MNAAFCGFTAGPAATQFVEEWLEHCTDARKLTDAPSECSKPELPDYLEHRHDQSICSLMAILQDLYLYRDPSQFGNYRKLPSLRVSNEYLEMPYVADSCDRSRYPTLAHHHRSGASRPSAARPAVTWLKTKLPRAFPKERPNPYLVPSDLARAIHRNHQTLAEAKEWFNPEADACSEFGYGVSATRRQVLNRPVGSQPNLPDLIVHLADSFGDKLGYLEIEVSVGKNFYQLIRAGSHRNLTGFDTEEIHPNLSSRLNLVGRTEWTPSAGTLRRTPSSLTEFWDPAGGNRVSYVAGDVYDAECWTRLQGWKFNLIFFGATARPESLMSEWRMIERYNLLDREEFVMVWDDVHEIMSFAFDRIAAEVQRMKVPCVKLKFMMLGCLGVNECPHQVGVVARLRNPPPFLRFSDGTELERICFSRHDSSASSGSTA